MGPTSHQISAWVKNIFGISKVGHGGTLDPRVTGVLPMAFNNTARLLSVFLYFSKEYVGVMRLHHDVQLKHIQRVVDEFIGPIYQLPPIRSAVKRQIRVRTIYSLKILEQNKRDIMFKVESEAGTYIRSLANDIGLVLGKGAHLQELRRTRSGTFLEKDSVTLHDLKDAVAFWKDNEDDTELRKCVMPMEILFNGLPKVIIQDSAVDAICHGADLAIPGIIQFDDIPQKGKPVAILSQKGEGIALGENIMATNEILDSDSGIAVRPIRVLMPPGTYQKGWKSKNK